MNADMKVEKIQTFFLFFAQFTYHEFIKFAECGAISDIWQPMLKNKIAVVSNNCVSINEIMHFTTHKCS